ncbi:MAG: PDGLE domain-containing protein [Clostridia bacterium]|nr:PDGLE domain-containing protein [Clostridia bacterium]
MKKINSALFILLVAVLIAVFLSPFASSWPDGLERVAEDTGFAHLAQVLLEAPFMDYMVPGVEAEGVSTSLAGLLGALAVFAATYLVGKLIVRRRSQQS